MKLQDLLSEDAIIADLQGTTKEGVIEELSDLIAGLYPEQGKEEIVTRLLEREKLGSTGIDFGIAIPHAKIRSLDHVVIAVGRSKKGVNFESHDGGLSHLFFVLLAPDNAAGLHLKTLAHLSKLLKEERVRIRLIECGSREEIYQTLIDEDK